MSHEIILEPADVFATRGKSWLSKAIRIFTRHIGESRTKVNHVGVVVEGGTLRDAVIVEQGAYVFRRLAFMKRYPICSWLVAHSSNEVGKHFDVDAGAATPDDIWDFCVGNPDKYRTVLELGPLYRCLHEP